MRYYIHSVFLAGLLALVLIVYLPGYATEKSKPQFQGQDCALCHVNSIPTIRDYGLKSCPRSKVVYQTSPHGVNEAPDTLVIGQLAEEYQPVLFDHKLHAEMAVLGQECNTCHHYSPAGRIPPCRSCHDIVPLEQEPLQPGLKEAYHRQCLSCHREWSHDSKCEVCHLRVAPGNSGSSAPEQRPDLPTAKIPVSRVYETSNRTFPIVTFQHVQHIELFDFSCVDCHKNEKCSYCHDPSSETRLAKNTDDIHAVCSGCHEIMDQCPEEDCVICHDTRARDPLFHQITGKALPRYCERLGCAGCHPEKRKSD